MSTNPNSGSAKIYQFPLSKRLAADRRREETKTANTLTVAPAPSIAMGSGWYHEEAVRDAERARNA